MATEREQREALLLDAFLAHEAVDPDSWADDPELSALARDLAALREAFDAEPAPPTAPAALATTTLGRGRAELAASRPSTLAGALARLAAALALPFAVAVLWNAAVWWWGPALLGGWLPGPLARGIPAAYVFGAAGWLALLCAALPALAHRQLVDQHQEALP